MVKREVVVYFGLLLMLTEVGVAESEKRVAAIFLLPVWASGLKYLLPTTLCAKKGHHKPNTF